MDSNNDKTLLQTIQARLERNEKGDIEAIFDPSGPWTIVEYPSSLTDYFKPASQPSIDKYGNKIDNHE